MATGGVGYASESVGFSAGCVSQAVDPFSSFGGGVPMATVDYGSESVGGGSEGRYDAGGGGYAKLEGNLSWRAWRCPGGGGGVGVDGGGDFRLSSGNFGSGVGGGGGWPGCGECEGGAWESWPASSCGGDVDGGAAGHWPAGHADGSLADSDGDSGGGGSWRLWRRPFSDSGNSESTQGGS